MTAESKKIQLTDSAILELFHERIAIMIHDAGLSQAKAEYEAAMELRRLYGRDNLPMEIREIGNAAFKKLKGLDDNQASDNTDRAGRDYR